MQLNNRERRARKQSWMEEESQMHVHRKYLQPNLHCGSISVTPEIWFRFVFCSSSPATKLFVPANLKIPIKRSSGAIPVPSFVLSPLNIQSKRNFYAGTSKFRDMFTFAWSKKKCRENSAATLHNVKGEVIRSRLTCFDVFLSLFCLTSSGCELSGGGQQVNDPPSVLESLPLTILATTSAASGKYRSNHRDNWWMDHY